MGVEQRRRTTTEAQHEVQRGCLSNSVLPKAVTIVELSTTEDQTLLIRRDTYGSLNFSFDHSNRVAEINVQCDRLARERLYEDLHTDVGITSNNIRNRTIASATGRSTSTCAFRCNSGSDRTTSTHAKHDYHQQ